MHIRFRYDKGPENFVTKKFRRVPNNFLCSVQAVTLILSRADRLGIPVAFPIGAFRPFGAPPGQFVFLTRQDVAEVMQAACIRAYPNPDHYLRRNIRLLQSHSNRVTAAVALSNAGVPIDIIAA